MRIEKLQAGHEDVLESFLQSHADTSMFLRSNLAQSGFAYQDAPCHGDYYAALTANGTVAGVLAHFWNGFIAAQSPDLEIADEIATFLRDLVTRPVSGFFGPPDQVSHLIGKFGLGKTPFALNHAEALFALNLEVLNTPSLPDSAKYELTGAESISRAILVDWMKAYEIEAMGSQPGTALDARTSERVDGMMKKPGNHWVLCVDGTPVSLCGLNARVKDCVQVGPVWTPPAHRSQAFARIGLAMALEKARQNNVNRAVLFTDSPAATKAYVSLGFVENGQFQLAILKQSVSIGKSA